MSRWKMSSVHGKDSDVPASFPLKKQVEGTPKETKGEGKLIFDRAGIPEGSGEGLTEKDGAGTVKSRESGDGKGQMKEHVLKNCIVKHYSD